MDTAVSLSETPGHDVCRPHGWKPFRSRRGDPPRKVYDLIMVNTELDWLEIRLNTTFSYVDYYVIVESDKTFTGMDKPLTVHDNMSFFAAYQSKIIHHRLQFPPSFKARDAWDREALQRNAMYDQVLTVLNGPQAPTPGDVIIVADVDEIPRPETLTLLRHCAFPKRLTLRSRFYYYGFQFLHRGVEWQHPQATYYDGDSTIEPHDLRSGGYSVFSFLWTWPQRADLWNSSWHCSSCFTTLAEMLEKMQSFSHVELNGAEMRNKDRIVAHVRNGLDLWDRRGQVYEKVEGNKDVPAFLLENPERFAYLLDRKGPNAGFTDYEG